MAQGDALAQAELFKFFSIDETFENERKRYIGAPSLPLRSKQEHNNSLVWWKVHNLLFPILARLAKLYLPIHATSDSSERVFSCASRIISNLRTGLNPDMAGRHLFFLELGLVSGTNESPEGH